ncbi:hypothetical protein [Kineococcus aurantiacus]|uniref:Uncharacterized protein n=1 Tax=Kineococcus aurantiacus TaxID=37633 RepID=A0A7Y9DL35_9ACTN|nr:hypothetical protein [Kineococcus aurantiacus]NYD22592.1 hypothetical protein [Kineococcus aurantiacus]
MSSGVADAPESRPVSPAAVLAVALLLLAVGTSAWVVWQLTADGRAPVAFRERSALPQCAPITVPQGQSTPVTLQDCLLSPGAQHDGAEVLVTSSTTEGDPVKTYYRVLPGGAVEVFTDATADAFGSEGWSHTRCPDVAALGSGEDCRPA